MEKRIEHLPDWTFWIDEVSAGVYQLKGSHKSGATVFLKGSDPNELLKQVGELQEI